MESTSLKVQCQAALALRNLASDGMWLFYLSPDALNAKLYTEKYQLEIVKADGLQPLLRLLQSTYLPLILSSAACVRNVSIHPQNESPIIESGFLQPLINLLSFKDNEEVQCHAISTLRNLAASSEKNKLAIVKAGAVHSIKELVLDVPMNVQSEMTACVAVLALSDDLKGQLLEMGICEVLIPLTNSPSSEVQGNSAAALGNLSSKGLLLQILLVSASNDTALYVDGRTASDDYSAFNDVWDNPEGGMHQYLHRFLASPDATFQHIAVWTIVQLLESGGEIRSPYRDQTLGLIRMPDPQLMSNIRSSNLLVPNVRELAVSRSVTPTSSTGGTPHSHRSQARSYQETDTGDGQGEIQELARKILYFVDGDEPAAPVGSVPSHAQPGSSVGHESNASGMDHEELRRSVRDALVGSSRVQYH